MPLASTQSAAQTLRTAAQALQARDLAGAERALAPFLSGLIPASPPLLDMAGVLRLMQRRFAEAADFFARGRAALPGEAMFAFNHARALAGQQRAAESAAAYREAVRLKPEFVEARYELGCLLHQSRHLDEAEQVFGALLRTVPGHAPARLMLGAVLIDAGKPEDAEGPLRRGLQETADPRLKAVLHNNLGMALRRQRKDAEALAECDRAAALDPALPGLALHRAEALQNLGRHDEALALLQKELARTPDDAGLHHACNDLLYRLDRKDAYLKSYDTAPQSRPLMLGKAYFLTQEKRGAEAHAVYAGLLARDPADRVAAIGAARSLMMMQRPAEAVTAFETLLQGKGDAALYSLAAEAALQAGDPQKAAWLSEQGLAATPQNGSCLAMLSIASRKMADERDETINGYDTLVRSFMLEPPEGFSSLDDFNGELNAALDRMHPATREFVNQSLRGGTQTPDQLFHGSLELVARLRRRIDEAVARYIAELGADAAHPFLARRAKGFRYAGSWSSRLRDCGFHVNHIHPDGWISSCYYVAVPDAVKDTAGQQGWIKFGEPSFEAGLENPVRRAIQPEAGKLVLFPSYTWHGTVPFRDAAARTTIAFDVVPTA